MARRAPEWPHWGRAPGQGRWTGVRGHSRGPGIDGLFLLTSGFLALTLVLGGSSQGNAWQLGVLELFSLVVIGWALPRLRTDGVLAGLWRPLALFAAIAAIPILQLIPLPFEFWATLPGRSELASALSEAGVTPAALPLSLAPARTLDSLLWLLIPAAVFLAVSAVSPRRRWLFLLLVIGAALASQTLGMLQLSGMDGVRFYEITNVESAVGLFANRNHNALYLLLALPLLAAWLRREGRPVTWIAFAAVGALAAVTLVSIIATHSRAGLALAAPAVIGALVLLLRGRRVGRRVAIGVAAGVVALFAMTTALLFSSVGFANRLGDLGTDVRGAIWSGTTVLAQQFAPVGSGIGAFQLVYPAAERPETLQYAYVNHAHNDYLEVWAEAGYAGAALIVVLAGWTVWLAARCWRARGNAAVMGQGGSLVVGLIALHSAVDYPARTPTIAAVLALSLALMVAGARERETNQ